MLSMSVTNWRKRYLAFRDSLPQAAKENSELVLAAFLRHEKKRDLKLPATSQQGRRRADAKRLHERKRQRILDSVYGPKRKNHTLKSPELLLFKMRDHFLRDQLCPNYGKNWIPIPKRLKNKSSSHIVIRDFSFIRNPRETLEQIRNLCRLSATSTSIRVDFVDEVCDDVSPYLVLAALMPSMPPVFSGGFISAEVASVIESVGLHDTLRVYRVKKRSKSKFPVLPFRMAVRNPPKKFRDRNFQLKPQTKEIVADHFCDTLEGWLDRYELELTPEGAQSLTNSITEALDNAERHGRPDVENSVGDWSMCGFSRLIEPEDDSLEVPRLECSFSIVNIGATIHESLQTADPSVRSRVDRYKADHKRSLSSELATTIVALQDGITRVAAASEARRGGVGLLELADLIADLGDTDQSQLQSRYTILSGSSCIQVTSPFSRGERSQGSQLRELWFNDQNSDTKLPSEDHAFTIRERFAGTVISAWFCIDPEFLRKSLKV